MEFGICVEMIFNKLPFEERLRKTAEASFRFVEMWFTDGSFKGSARDLADMARRFGLTITNTVIGSPDGRIGGGLTDRTKRRQWLERARHAITYTRDAGIPGTIVCTGNIVPGASDEAMAESVVQGLCETVAIAEEAGVMLLLEPLNSRYDHPGYWLTSSDRGAEICRRIGSPRLKLLFDCYHMQIMEGDLLRHIERNLDVIGHFHCAGVPGRNEPWLGEVNYPFLVRRIEQMGYKGVFGLEYRPTLPHEESIRKTLEYLST